MLNKNDLVCNVIKKVLNKGSNKPLPYICIKINGVIIGYYNSKDNSFAGKLYEENANKILLAEKIGIHSAPYGKVFKELFCEEINFEF